MVRSPERDPTAAPPLTISPEAARRLSAEADLTRAVLSVRHVLGCGGTGFRLSVEEDSPEEGRHFESQGIPIVMDDYAVETLAGAVLEIDPDPAGDGYRLDHPNAALTTFC
jgi:Fe-S cluster assembly iron-binding protein IscA